MNRSLVVSLSLLFAGSAAAATYSLVPSPGVVSCSGTVVVASYGSTLAAPSGCSKTTDSTAQSMADFYYQLDQAVGLETLTDHADLLYLARRHRVQVPSFLTAAHTDLHGATVDDVGADLGDIAAALPEGRCDWSQAYAPEDLVCTEAVVNGRTMGVCALLGVSTSCMLVAM